MCVCKYEDMYGEMLVNTYLNHYKNVLSIFKH